jgi:hypothetical protein
MGFKDEMQQFDEEAAEGAARQGTYSRLPDGRHQVIIAEYRMEQDDGEYTVTAKFQNKDGSIRKWYNISRDGDQGRIARESLLGDSRMLGYEGELSDIEEWIESGAPLDQVCEIYVKTKAGQDREFTNVYMNRVVSAQGDPEDFKTEGGGDFAPSGGVIDDDIPF